jgi:hypothetical protein
LNRRAPRGRKREQQLSEGGTLVCAHHPPEKMKTRAGGASGVTQTERTTSEEKQVGVPDAETGILAHETGRTRS